MLDAVSEAKGLLTVVRRLDFAEKDPLTNVVAAELTFRAMHLLAIRAVGEAQAEYSVSLQALMHAPEPASDGARDALLDERDFLGFRDLLDLISDIELPCIAPRLHRGWQDRRQSCRQARRVSEEALGLSLSAEDREPLLIGWGICHRVLRIPPPIELDESTLAAAFPPLLRLIEVLAPDDAELNEAIDEIRAAVAGS